MALPPGSLLSQPRERKPFISYNNRSTWTGWEVGTPSRGGCGGGRGLALLPPTDLADLSEAQQTLGLPVGCTVDPPYPQWRYSKTLWTPDSEMVLSSVHTVFPVPTHLRFAYLVSASLLLCSVAIPTKYHKGDLNPSTAAPSHSI